MCKLRFMQVFSDWVVNLSYSSLTLNISSEQGSTIMSWSMQERRLHKSRISSRPPRLTWCTSFENKSPITLIKLMSYSLFILTPCGRENFKMKFRIWIMYWSKMYDVCYVQFYLSKYPINANAHLSNSHLSQLLPWYCTKEGMKIVSCFIHLWFYKWMAQCFIIMRVLNLT